MNAIPQPVCEGIQALLRENSGTGASRLQFTPVGGGCVNHGGRLTTGEGDNLFLKWNYDSGFPGMFEAEARGLELLYTTAAIRIPQVVGTGRREPHQFILMEFIEGKPRSGIYWDLLGQRLARLHRNSNENFGLDHDNYIGSLPQSNTPGDSWIEFFISERLQVQLKAGIDAGQIDPSIASKFERLYSRLPEILTAEPPSLLHGDLWSGNLIVDEKGDPCLIDPAVYYGNREVDLAMTKLFGGFDERFYNAYQEAFSTAPGLGERLDIYNLYPLLVHVNLFGQGYLNQVASILRAYT